MRKELNIVWYCEEAKKRHIIIIRLHLGGNTGHRADGPALVVSLRCSLCRWTVRSKHFTLIDSYRKGFIVYFPVCLFMCTAESVVCGNLPSLLRNLDEISTGQSSQAVMYQRLCLISAALTKQLLHIFFSPDWVWLIFLSELSPLHLISLSLPTGSWSSLLSCRELTGNPPEEPGQPLIPEFCYSSCHMMSCTVESPQAPCYQHWLVRWGAQMVACTVRLLLSACSHSCYPKLSMTPWVKGAGTSF